MSLRPAPLPGVLVGLATSTVAVLLAAATLEGLARLRERAPAQQAAQGTGPIDPVAMMAAVINSSAPGLVEPDPALGYRLRPGATSPPHTINARGYRGPVVTPAKPGETYRVIALGGSTTFGWGVSEDDAYPRILEHLLNRRCTPSLSGRVEVINGGVPGYISTQDWIALQSRWLAYQPDLVIVMMGLNDVAAGLMGGARLRPPTLWPVSAHLRRIYEAALRHSAFARWYARQLHRWTAWRAGRAPTPTFASVAARAIGESLEGIHRLVAARGVHLALVAYPGLFEGDAPDFPGVGGNAQARAVVRSSIENGLQPARALMERWAAGHAVPWVDLRGPFRERGPGAHLYLTDGMHFTRAGNKVVAEVIYRAVFRPWCATKGETAQAGEVARAPVRSG